MPSATPRIGPASEEEALLIKGPNDLRDTIAAAADLERQVRNAAGLQSVILRYGHLYGPDTWYARTAPSASSSANAGSPSLATGWAASPSFMSPTPPPRLWPPSARPQPASTTSWTTNRPRSASGCPGTRRPWAPRHPGNIPATLARLATGGQAVYLAHQRGASNTRVRRHLGWRLRYGSWRAGFAATAGSAYNLSSAEVAG